VIQSVGDPIEPEDLVQITTDSSLTLKSSRGVVTLTHGDGEWFKFVMAATELMYPVPKGAIEVGHVALSRVYEEDHFFLLERYPHTSAVKHYASIFSRWRLCHGSDEEWQSFGDASHSEPVFVHQLMRHWVNRQNDVAVTLVLRYESPGLTDRETPSTNRQFVVLTRLRQMDADKELAPLRVKCARGT
jgi:hypothetical protein